MPPMPTLTRIAALAPPKRDPELWTFLLAVATPDRDAEGNFVLRRALTATEIRVLTGRVDDLTPWLEGGDHKRTAAAVAKMLLGFSASGRSTSEAEFAAVATQYAMALASVPAWAVERACLRFASGSVKAEEVGAHRLDPAFAPTSAMVRIVAAEVARPHGEELNRVRKTLAGRPAPQEEGGKPLPASVAAYLAEKNEDARKIGEDKVRMTPEQRAAGREAALAEYDRLGRRRPADDPKRALVSPSLLMTMGWSIEEVGGERVLVAPAKVPA